MTRVLFAWELGGNLGHLSRDLPLAKKCLEAGYDVVWAVPDLAAAQTLIDGRRYRLMQAPLLRPSATPPRPPANYADMLLCSGYEQPDALIGAVRSWRNLMALVVPDVLVFNHAPTALIAARIAGVPVYMTGTGFEVPPNVTPMPTFRRWKPAIPEHLAACDAKLLDAINGALLANGAVPIDSIGQLGFSDPPMLSTFPELDPFGPRADAQYIGPVYSLPKVTSVDWTPGSGARVFVYIRPNLDGCDALLSVLNSVDGEVVCFMPGVNAEQRTAFAKVRFFSDPIDIEKMLTSANVVVTSGAGTIATALLAGVPVLVVPQFLEQQLAGDRLVQLGAGMSVRDRRTPSLFGAMLHQLLTQGEYKQRALEFSQKYQDYDPDSALRAQFDTLQDIAIRTAQAQ